MSDPFESYTFGRIAQWDERNEGYRVRSLLASQSPRPYTWPCKIPILDQDGLSACVGFTAGAELAAVPDAVKGITNETCTDLYFNIQANDEWPGSERPGDSPRAYGTSVLAMAKLMVDLGNWTGYRWARTLDEVIQAVGRVGPVCIGVDWTSRCMDTDAKGFIHPELGSVVGGHAVLIRGHSVKLKAFRIRNSWGPGWGDEGECLVSYLGIQTWLASGGEFVLPERRKR